MRVGLIAGTRFPVAQPFAGGLEAHTWLLSSRLARRGRPVTVFAPQGSDPRLITEPMPTPPAMSEGTRADLAAQPDEVMYDHHVYLALMLGLRDAAGRFDVIHNNSVHHLPVAMASAVPVPMVTTLHTPPTPWLESALCLRGAATAGAFVAVSRHTARSWAHLVPDATVIPNGIDLEAWSPGPGGGDVAWSGRIVPEKAPHLAIDAARAAGMAIRLAGPAHDQSYWEREIAPRLGPDARWAGHLGQADLCRFVGSAAVSAVTPDWDEPFGLVVLESLACGTPVAGFARGGVPEVIDEGTGVLCSPGDVAALAGALRVAARLDRAACRRRAELVGCADRMADAYDAVYASLAS
jgi:glycosyltransferase involved in cell wall biosynthesis